MKNSDALWEVFKATGYIGAYLLYKDCAARETETVTAAVGNLYDQVNGSGTE